MASVITQERAPARVRPPALQPAEGWMTVLLHLAIVVTAAWSVNRAEWAPGLHILSAVSVGGLLFGLLLAKGRVPDTLAHLLAMLVGAAVVIWLAASDLDNVVGGRRARLRALGERIEDWYQRLMTGRQVDDEVLFVVVLGITLWLVAYTSAWVLYRRGWLTTALLLPGVILVINLGYAPEQGTAPLLGFVLIGCVMATRHYAFRRALAWDRARLPAPPRLSWRFLTAGANLALVVGLLGWTLPLSTRGTLVETAWDQIDQPYEAVQRRLERWFERINPGGRSAGGAYASFGESFRLGGPLRLGDDPVAKLETANATYLVAHRYDRYDGRGWSSDIEATFDEISGDGKRYSPQITFSADQPVYLSPDVQAARVTTKGRLTVIEPKGDLLLTMDTYVTADRPTSVQLSWRQLNAEPFSVRDGDTAQVPVDLRELFWQLQRATFAPNAAGVSPSPDDPALAAAIRQEQEELASRFLTTTWEVNGEGRAETLIVTGQVPVYDDVEAVFGQQAPVPNDVYVVSGLGTLAAPGALRAAGQSYPGYVTDRYLQLPGTVTEETRALAAQLAQGLDNPFDIATAIQNDLRDRITYREDIEFPPANRDVVDFVLFESQEGYCEYYASAMTVMLRTLNIPARVAVGFFAVPFDEEEQGYLYRERNAHAWVEVFFPGYGWVPFEPTQSQPTFSYGETAAEPEPVPLPTVAPTPSPAPTPTPTPAATPPAPAGTTTPPPPEPAGAPGFMAWAVSAIGVVIFLALLIGVGLWMWSLRGLSPVSASYAQTLRLGRWWGIRPMPSTTPAEYAEQLGRVLPAAAAPARTVAQLFVEERYSGRPPSAAAAASGRAAWRQVRRALVGTRLTPRRARRRRSGAGE